MEKAAQQRWDLLTKPQGSLGSLEELGIRLAGMTGKELPCIQRKVIFTVAGDHGVVEEGISSYPQSVTVQMVDNFLKGTAAINVLASHAGAEVIVVDAGVASPIPQRDGLVSCKIRFGTGNMTREPAMRPGEAVQAVEAGLQVFRRTHQANPIHLVGLGDMGIGNTTASAALTAVLTGREPSEVTGRGTGLQDAQLLHKVSVIQKALRLHHPNPSDPLDCLAKVGGLEIGCLAGITLAAAEARVPVVLDGFITSAAALLACRIVPEARHYLIASHQSVEPGHVIQLNELGLKPLLNLGMRLGEGTGAALAFSLIEASVRLLGGMATFGEAGVDTKIR